MENKITLGEIYGLRIFLGNLNGFKNSVFNYFIAKNIQYCDNELKGVIEEEKRLDELLKEYQEERTALLVKISNKNELNEPIILDGSYDILGKEKEFDLELKKIQKKFSKELAEHKKQTENFNKLLETQCDSFKPYKIKPTDVPNEVTTEQFNVLFMLIK